MSFNEALGMWAEAAQYLSSAGLSFTSASFYNCADLANEVAEKALQAVYALRHDGRAAYDHDLRALGAQVGAPPEVQADLDALTPYHPSSYLASHDAATADDDVGPQTAQDLMVRARRVLQWARPLVLGAS